MLINFESRQVFEQTLDIEDPGNCCIRCKNDEYFIYYLLIKSIRGKVHILEYGPVAPDIIGLIPGFNVKYNVIKFDLKRLYSTISNFLNDPKKIVTGAEIVDEEEAYDDFPNDIKSYREID